jgi:hypothetical protein
MAAGTENAFGKPDDIACATRYLCGRAGSQVTGILPINGGRSVQHRVKLFRD